MQDQIKVSIETTDGRAVRVYSHDGRFYIESHEDMVYRIRVKNKTGKRIKAVIAVDSISIITGKAVTFKAAESGYILEPYAEEVFKGYRVDHNQVAEFKFVKRDASYATGKGEGANNGVIAVWAYAEKEKAPAPDMAEFWRKQYEDEKSRPKEKEYVYPWRPYWERPYHRPLYPHHDSPIWCSASGYSKSSNTLLRASAMGATSNNVGSFTASLCSADAGESTRGIIGRATVNELGKLSSLPTRDYNEHEVLNVFAHGSSWGDALADKVNEVNFETGKLLEEVVIYYAPAEGLKALGVDLTREKKIAFPQPYKTEFCSAPAGWGSGIKR